MNKLLMAALGLGLIASAQAADTSTSIVARAAPKPVGEWPTVSYVHATATAAGSMTYDVLPSNVPTSKIAGCQTTTENATGKAKLLTASRSGRTVTISAGTSDTLIISDTARTVCVLRP